ncbi:MAG TPA: glycosyltransferase family 39 protein [Thermoanaerobaculia bacterium]|nr:glycosyltransferase family 39 protein [Thermoanaerobaculia bacterium]
MRPSTRWVAVAIGVAALALAFRCWRLASAPPGLYIDEVLTARNAIAWRLDPHASLFGSRPLLMPGWVETSNLYLAFASTILALGGDGLLGIRLVSVLPSLAAVPLLYWLGAQLAGRRTGILAAFLLACSHWAARSGRTGWDAVLMVTLQLAALGCLVHAQRRGRIAPAFAGGVLVALLLYTYVASRLVLFHATLWLAWEGIALLRRPSNSADDNRVPLQRALLRLFAFLLAIIVIAAPLQQQPAQADNSVRITQLSVLSHDHPSRLILDNVLGHLLMFHVRGGSYARDALPGFPMLDPITGTLFLLGLVAVALPAASALIRRLRRRRRAGALRGEGSQPRAAVLGEHGWDTPRQAGPHVAAPPSAQPPSRSLDPERTASASASVADSGLRFRLLLSWPAVMVLGGVLSTSGEGPPYPYRVLALAPWACLVAAIGATTVWDAAVTRSAPFLRRAAATLVLLAVVAINAWVLFIAGPADPGTRHVYGVAPTRLGLWLADHARSRLVVILPNALTSPPMPRGYPYAKANPTNFFRPQDDIVAVQLASGLYRRHPERALAPRRPAGDIDLLLALPRQLSGPTILVLPPSLLPEAARRFQVDRRTDLRDPSGARLATLLEARPRRP